MAGGLLTDLYELNMAASYLRRGMTGPATFSLFVRQLPADRGFLIAAGLEDCLRFLEEFSFTGGDLAYLRREQGYGEDTLRAFEGLRFTGEVWAVPEGRVVFAGELWVPKTCVTWADALESAVPCPVPGEPVSGRPDVR